MPMPRLGTAARAASILVALLAVATTADAQTRPNRGPAGGADSFALEASLETRLAYVITGNAALDDTSRAGLSGGTILLNSREPVDAPETIDGNTANAQRLRQIGRGIAIPPLMPVPPEHVLTKAFYLLQDFPGRYAGGQLWVEQAESRVNDGVSSLIIGGSDWAGAWAVDDGGRAMFPVIPGGEGQREMAYRFGVNLVMYALTGNYKADQVHVPAILERLGQ